MSDKEKTKKQLISEIEKLRRQVRQFDDSISEHEQSVKTFRNEQKNSQTLFNIIDDFLLVLNSNGKILAHNPVIKERLGYSSEELNKMNVFDFHPREYAEMTLNNIDAAAAGETKICSIPLITNNRKLIPVESKFTKGCWNGQDALFCLYRDITKRKRAEVEVNMLSHALKNISECIMVMDLKGNIIFVNDSFLETYGYEKDELIGRPVNILHSENNPPDVIKNIIPATLKARWQGELTSKRKDGVEFSSSLSTSIVEDGNGKPVVIIGVLQDISERKLLEDQLRQAQKMEAIGQLAGGVAHDFNNLLTVINGYSELTFTKIDETSPFYNYIKQIRRASERAGSLTQQLLAFSRRQILHPKVLNLNDLVQESSIMLKRLIGEDIGLSTLLKQDIGQIKADPTQIEQVVMNLAINARDAMLQGGQLTIETKKVFLDESYCKHHKEAKPGYYVMLSVSDTGLGMSREVQSRIFEPFFTTKEKAKGTGLGLATVYGIVKQSGGNIWVYSEQGKGTTFKIYLPCIDVVIAKTVESKTDKAKLGGKETILVVEDEFLVRELVCDSLRQYGYNVLEASDGSKAKVTYKEYKGQIHLVLTDVVMPKMSGRKLIESLVAVHPEVKALYMSGYTDDAVVNHGILEPEMAFIQKPFSPVTLVQKVQEVLYDSSNN